MKRLAIVAAAGTMAVCAGCATPDSVALQATKIDALQREVKDLDNKIDKVSETAKKALEIAQNAAQKVETATKLVK